MDDGTATLSIGEVSDRSGLSVHALRFYEREGLLPNPVRRTRSGHRLYTEWDVEWLGVCTTLRSSGMPLASIRMYATLVREGGGNEEERLALLREHQARVADQLVELTRCMNVITAKADYYQEHLARANGVDAVESEPQTPSGEEDSGPCLGGATARCDALP